MSNAGNEDRNACILLSTQIIRYANYIFIEFFTNYSSYHDKMLRRYLVLLSGAATQPVKAQHKPPQAFQPTTPTVLVIVESPNKVKLIESYLRPLVESGKNGAQRVKVMATVGHFMEIADVKLNEKFSVKWQLTEDKRSFISLIREAISHPLITEVVLASDPDREGELIAAHVRDALFPKKSIPNFSRAYFYAMTNDSIIDGYQKRQEEFIDRNLVESALARHILDRMFGFCASSALMMHNKQCRSIGRVQTPALIQIFKREQSIEEYEKRGVTYTFSIDPIVQVVSKENSLLGDMKGSLCGGSDKVYTDIEECKTRCAELKASIVDKKPLKVTLKEISKSKAPAAPFTMVTLIEAASRILRMKGDAVNSAAQALFTKGLITYPRSDSERLSDDFEAKIASYISNKYGKPMVFAGKKVRKSSTNAEGAHEAIRPTDISALPSKVRVEEGNVRALYALIHDHTVASRMIPTVTRTAHLTIDLDEKGLVQVKIAQNYISEFGYLNAFGDSIIQEKQTNDQSEQMQKYEALKSLQADSVRVGSLNVTRHSDSKPTRFTEGSLVTALKTAGIGRPSTYAATLQKLNERGYSSYHDSKGKLALGANGKIASEFALKKFEKFVRMDFTGSMETQLNDIAKGGKCKVDVVQSFWNELKHCLPYESSDKATSVQEFTRSMRGWSASLENKKPTPKVQ